MLEPTQVVKQVVDFQKKAMDSTFDALTHLQDQAEQFVTKTMSGNVAIPAEGQKVIEECFKNIKKGREDFRTAVTDGFDKVESFFASAANAVKK